MISRTIFVLIVASQNMLPVIASALSLSSQNFPLRVDYERTDQADLAQVILGAAESTWQILVLDLGYRAPFTSDLSGAIVPGMSLAVASTGMGAGSAMANWGADVQSTSNCDCSGSIVIDSATAATTKAVAEGVFHEFHHALEYAVDCTEAPSAYEGFTIAAVSLEFPESTIVPWVISQFQAFPEYPLDYWTMTFPCNGQVPCFPYQLGAALFPLYLMERFGQGDPRALREIYERFSQSGVTTVGAPYPSCSEPNHPNWFEGVELYLRDHGSGFDQAFTEFSAWRAIVGSHDDQAHYQRGSTYQEPAVALTQQLSPSAGGTLKVHAYGSRFLEFTNLNDAAPGPWKVQIIADPTTRWSASLLLWRNQMPVERVPFVFSNATAGASLENLSGVTRLLLVVSQHSADSYSPDAMAYNSQKQFSFQWTPDVQEAGSEQDAGTQEVDGGNGETTDDDGGGRIDEIFVDQDQDVEGADSGMEVDEPGHASTEGCSCGALLTSPIESWVLLLLGMLVIGRLRRRSDC